MGQLPNFVQLLRSDEKREMVLLLNENGEIAFGFSFYTGETFAAAPKQFQVIAYIVTFDLLSPVKSFYISRHIIWQCC